MFTIAANASSESTVIPASECSSKVGQDVVVEGFVHRLRSLGGANFLVLRDGRGQVQAFVEADTPGLRELKAGYIVRISGFCRPEERAPEGFEIDAKKIEVVVEPPEELPITINKKLLKLSLDVDLNNRPISLRHPNYWNIFKIQEGLVHGFREYLGSTDFTEIFTPKIVAAGAEGGANIFSMNYFGTKAFLAQSPQFYKQMMVGVFSRVFEVAHVYRAEPHNTSRHLNEYVSMDLEMGFIDDFYDIMKMETACLAAMFEKLKTDYSKELEALKITAPDASNIPVFHVQEAHELIAKHSKHEIEGDGELTTQEERVFGEIVKKRFGSEFAFVTHYDSDVRPFYAMDNPDNPEETLSFDLLFRGMEITTGGQRIHDYDQLVAKLKAKGMNPDDFTDYLMIFKHGMPPHGGLGMGLERLTSLITGFDNVRYGSLFPRDLDRLTP